MRLSSYVPFKAMAIALVAAAAALGLQYFFYTKQQTASEQVEYARQEEQLAAGLELQTSIPSLGFDNLIASWTFLQFIQYYGDTEARNRTGYTLNQNYFEQVATRDPRFYKANLILSPATSLFGGRPDLSVELLGKTIPAQPPASYAAYYTRTYRAVDQMLFLGDLEGARQAYEEAAAIAEAIPDALLAQRARETAAFLASNPDTRSVRLGAWMQILSQATDEKTRDLALEEIRALGGRFVRNPDGTVSVSLEED